MKALTWLLILFSSNAWAGFPPMQITAKAQSSQQEFWVTKDKGLDTNDCSRFKPCKTIGAAITVANAISSYYKQTIIHIAPINNGGSAGGNYNENVSLTQQGVNLVCDQPGAYTRPCTVGGTLTVNLTGTSGGTNFNAASNEVMVLGLVFTSGTSDTVTFSGSTFQRLIAMSCYFQASGARSAVNTNTGVSGSTPSEFRSYDTTFENNSSTIETVRLTSGRFWLYGTTPAVQNKNASGPSFIQDGPSDMTANITQFVGQYRLSDNTATATFNLSTIASGSAACLTTPASPNTGYALFAYAGCNSSVSPSITGTGVVVFATGNACIGTGCSTASTVTTSSLARLPEGGVFIQGSTGALTALSTNEIVGYGKTVRAMKIENMVGAAATFTCTVNPAVTLYDCGTSAGACTSGRTALANVTLTAANSGANGSVTSSTLAAGHYWALEISAGTCTILDANVSAEAAMQ
jgi:hypothetical protein